MMIESFQILVSSLKSPLLIQKVRKQLAVQQPHFHPQLAYQSLDLTVGLVASAVPLVASAQLAWLAVLLVVSVRLA